MLIVRSRPITNCLRQNSRLLFRSMVVRYSTSHEERTAAQPREKGIEHVILEDIQRVNDSIRLMRLNTIRKYHTIQFLPGQWLDVFLPGLTKAGGFTITSTPAEATPTQERPAYLELAIQRSSNPPAQWLWRPVHEIDGQEIRVRVGGSFTWPPQALKASSIKRLVLIAGGVGINPLISILAHLEQQPEQLRPDQVVFLYGTKAGSLPIKAEEILFMSRLMDILKRSGTWLDLRIFLTDASNQDIADAKGLPPNAVAGRITQADLEASLGEVERRAGTACYVCGPAAMTDTFVAYLASLEGMSANRVLCEKWW